MTKNKNDIKIVNTVNGKTLKKESYNGNEVYTLGNTKVFLNTINHNNLAKAMEFQTEKFDFVSWSQLKSNEIIHSSILGKGMTFANWQKFFTKLETPKTNSIYQGVMLLGKCLANGEGIGLSGIAHVPNNQVASSPTANLDTSEIVNQVIRQLKEGLAK
tara:strand:+ start:257 stop:733 length:477 start_codon:yes stop_codon:yes gene_type:complete